MKHFFKQIILFIGLSLISISFSYSAGCGTMERYYQLEGDRSLECFQEGEADNPNVRDINIPNASTPIKYVRLYIHTFSNEDGTNQGITEGRVTQQMDYMNEVYEQYRIQFEWEFEVHLDGNYVSVNNQEYNSNQIQLQYNADPSLQHNIYVVSTSGVDWAGVSHFPWMYGSTTGIGCTFVDEDYFGHSTGGVNQITGKTFVHEIGHALGLWHTFHGVDEVNVCGNCYEFASGEEGDLRGDFCSDTRPHPTNSWSCSDPGGEDCEGTPWGETPVDNFMSYSDDWCQEEFTLQQAGRMHAWLTTHEIGGWVVEIDSYIVGDPNNDGFTTVQDILLVITYITGQMEPEQSEELASDLNTDGNINIQDIILMINIIMGNKSIESDLDFVSYQINNQKLIINSTEEIAGLELTVESLTRIENNYLDEDWEIIHEDNKILIYNLVGKNLPNGELIKINNHANIESGIAVNWSGKSTELVKGDIIGNSFHLIGAYPNPFNPETSISYKLEMNGHVQIMVYDIAGQNIFQLHDGFQLAGTHSINFNASNLSSGIYFIKSQFKSDAGIINQTLKINLLK